MSAPNLIVIFIVSLISGILLTFLGCIIKFYNAGNIVNFYNPKKHDKDKASKLFGRNLIIIGSVTLCIAPACIFIAKSYYIFVCIALAIFIPAGLLITYYQLFKHCKINDKK